jgi:hypothetical protein
VSSVLRVLRIVAASLLGFSFGILAVLIGVLLLCNLAGLLFGFSKPSPACDAYHEKRQSNFQYYLVPVTRYACKENAGLLQPYTSDFIRWFGAPAERNSRE